MGDDGESENCTICYDPILLMPQLERHMHAMRRGGA